MGSPGGREDAHLVGPPPPPPSLLLSPPPALLRSSSGSVGLGRRGNNDPCSCSAETSAAAAAALAAGAGSQGSGEPRSIAEDRKARARRGEPAGPRRARVPGSSPFAIGALDAPPGSGSEAAGCARTWEQGGSAEAAGGRRVRALIPASLSPGLPSAASAPPSAPRKQERTGPEAEQQPPSDHAPVSGADFEGNLAPTAWARPASCELPGPRKPRSSAARRGALVYAFLGSPADRGLVFADGAQRWWLQVAAAASAGVASAARARSRDL